MSAARVMEAVDVLEDGGFGLATGFPNPASDQFGLDDLEERPDSGVVMAVALAAHGRLQGVAVRSFLVVVRRVLATTVVIRTASLRSSSVLPMHFALPFAAHFLIKGAA